MPTAAINGVEIYYEVAGRGFPLLLSHEFAGDIRSWEPQVNFFSRRYQVITYCARGYTPSEVPDDPEVYSQDHLVEDAYGLLRHKRPTSAGCRWVAAAPSASPSLTRRCAGH